jgi:hypothetical protein
MEGILNFDQPLDVALLDRVVNTLFTGYGEEVILVIFLMYADPLVL